MGLRGRDFWIVAVAFSLLAVSLVASYELWPRKMEDRRELRSEEESTFDRLDSLRGSNTFASWVINQEEPTLEQLRGLLANEDRDTRYMSAILLTKRKQLDVLPVVFQAVADSESSLSLRYHAVTTLHLLPTELLQRAGAFGFFQHLLAREDVIENEGLFWDCLSLLLKDKDSLKGVEELLDEEVMPNSLKEEIAVGLVAKGYSSPALTRRMRTYIEQPGFDKVRLALRLAEMGDQAILDDMIEWLDAGDISEEDKLRISEKLLELNNAAGEKYLSRLVEQGADYEIVYRAASILNMFHFENGFRSLIEGYNSRDAEIRKFVVEQMGDTGDDRFLETLKHATRDDADPEVKKEAAWAMSQIRDFLKDSSSSNSS